MKCRHVDRAPVMSLGYQKLCSIRGRVCAAQGNSEMASIRVTLLDGLASLISPYSGRLMCVGKESLCQCYAIAKRYTQHFKCMVSLDARNNQMRFI